MGIIRGRIALLIFIFILLNCNEKSFTLPLFGDLKMSKSKNDDFTLCSKTCEKINEKFGHHAIATDFPEEERVAILVWNVTGIIENGGFRYLFESTLPGDPHLDYTIKAFERIQCQAAVDAIKEALCLFPNCRLPEDTDRCIAQYENHPEVKRKPIDMKFWNQVDNITKLLAKYIREVKLDEKYIEKSQKFSINKLFKKKDG